MVVIIRIAPIGSANVCPRNVVDYQNHPLLARNYCNLLTKSLDKFLLIEIILRTKPRQFHWS
jgi:hypothetical protein